jgi:hypothetical protein
MQAGKAAPECNGFKAGSFFSIRSNQRRLSSASTLQDGYQGYSLFENRWG